jgi:tRNA(Ile)-lysidine synthase
LPSLKRLDPAALFAGLADHPRLGLAVSGGPDSLALMLLMAQWVRRGGPQLFVYTVDHALRPEAADEAAMVAREAERLGLNAHILRWEGNKPATGVQAAARRARYRLLAAAMKRDEVELLVTAHHLGDQAETVLMRMAHGSGIDGLRGMDALSVVEGCAIARPLLGVDPVQLRAVVDAAGIIPAADPSNLDPAYERVRWRQLLPALAAEGLTPQRLAALAGRLDHAGALVAEAAQAAWQELVEWQGQGKATLPHAGFAELNPLVGVALLGQLLEAVSGKDRPASLGALEDLQGRLARVEKMKPLTLHGCIISADGKSVRLRREGPRRTPARKPAA